MKYPISLNEKDLEIIKQVGRYIGIDDINKVYGAIPKILRFSYTLTAQTIQNIEKSIPNVEPEILDILLSSIRKIKVAKYHKQKKEMKIKKKKLV